MTQLERLELRGNQITKIEGLDALKHLKLLTLSNNQIKSIAKEEMPELPELNDLGLFGNYIGNNDKGTDTNTDSNNKSLINLCILISTKMPNLKSIYLGGNIISSIKTNDDIIKIAKENIKSLERFDGHNIK